MTRLRLLLAAAASILVVTGVAGADGTPLQGSVGPGFTISLASASGAAVSHLDAGAYTLVVGDTSEEHNFHLQGPGDVDVLTGISDVGTKTFNVTLVDGTYTFVCDPHNSRMHGSFTVGTASAGGSAGGGSGAGGSAAGGPGATQRLTLAVTAKSVRLTTAGGAAVTALDAGPAVVTVRDRSATRGVKLAGAGAATATTARFVGTKTWKGTLRPGTLVASSTGLRPVRVKVS